MSKESPSATAPGAFKRCWCALRKPSVKYSFLGIASLFFVLGIIFWGGFNTGMEATNKLEFCISCHEMRDNVYQEYRKTIHFSNRTGVRAICSDCHVPHEWTYKLIRKSKATLEIWAKLTGRVDTKHSEAKRLRKAYEGEGGRADMHRLPQGNRASLA
jgi:cytochrome c-type protein NapC